MKIIPKGPVDASRVADILDGQTDGPFKAYAAFLGKYGGGQIFPNSVRMEDPIPLEGPLRVFSVQSFYDPDRIEQRSASDDISRDFTTPFRTIAAVSGGDSIILSLDPKDPGAIWFWGAFSADGIHGTKRRVADSFADLLQTFAFYEDQGMTPPWNRMSSVDDAPAVDLVLEI